MLTYGSLCSGYGGLDLAVEHVFDARPMWHAEVDPHASKVLAAHWPDTPNLGDLTTVDWTTVPPVDVLCAGYPCQPFSHAGQRRGTNDDRHLWPHIADAVRVLRPRYLVCENVAGHLSMGFDSVLCDLADLGFHVEWGVLRASDVGACHRRTRLFFVAADTDHGPINRERARSQPGWRGEGGDRTLADACGAAVGQSAGGPPPQEEPRGRAGHRPGDPRGERPAFDWRATPYAAAIERHQHLTGRPAPHPAPDGRLSPEFVEWMMCLPAGWVTGHGLSRTAAVRMLGNGVVPPQAAAAIGELLRRHNARTPIGAAS